MCCMILEVGSKVVLCVNVRIKRLWARCISCWWPSSHMCKNKSRDLFLVLEILGYLKEFGGPGVESTVGNENP